MEGRLSNQDLRMSGGSWNQKRPEGQSANSSIELKKWEKMEMKKKDAVTVSYNVVHTPKWTNGDTDGNSSASLSLLLRSEERERKTSGKTRKKGQGRSKRERCMAVDILFVRHMEYCMSSVSG